MLKQTAASILCLMPIVSPDPTYADRWLLEDGSYEVAFRLELPHLERWAVEKKITVCVSESKGVMTALAPILSDNNPFAGCSARDVYQDEGSLTFEIICSGRDAAKAQATYTLAPDGFHARIEMTMAAKNMTMTEVQIGRRVGRCRAERQE
jgi:Protein of unknown function (DUF3617)